MAFTQIVVTRTYKTPSGHPAQGVVKFIPSNPMVNGTTTISAPEQVALSKTGAISVTLAANNDPSTTPTGTTYRVTETFVGQDIRSYNVVIPYNAPSGTVDLSTLAPVLTTTPAVQYVSSVNGQSGAVTVAATAPSDATTTTKGIARILGGTADAPSVPWTAITGAPTVVDATTSIKGVSRILGGTADAPTVPWSALTSVPSYQPLDTLLTRVSADAVTIPYAASVTPDASQSCVFDITATGNLTLADISNGIDGQAVCVRVTASGGTRTLVVTGIYSLSITSGGRWVGWFRYDGSGGWQLTESSAVGLSGSGTGVLSVNGQTGAVVLTPDSFTDGTTNHVFTASDDTKLGGVATGATANSSDATLLARANHTGTQTASTVSDFSEAVDDRVATLIVAGTNITKSYDDTANALTISAASLTGTNPDNALSGATGDGTTSNNTPFNNAYVTVAGSTSNLSMTDGNQRGTKVIYLSAGTYLVTADGSLMRDLTSPRAQGYVIRGAGRGLTTIVFSPTVANQYLLRNADDWLHCTFEDITFKSTVSTASFMLSNSTGGAQNYAFNRCNWEGTWKYGIELTGNNVNSELSWYHCGIYGDWTAFLYSDTTAGSDQFLDYNFFACNNEVSTGHFIDMARGGNINVWGGSLIHIGNGTQSGSSAQTFFMLRGGDHSGGVQRLFVSGARVEHRHENSTLIDCEWKRGNVTFLSCDTESQQYEITNPQNVIQAKFGISGDQAPIIVWDSCTLMGKHRYSYDNNSWQYRRIVKYKSCEIETFTRAVDFVTINGVGSPGNTAGQPTVAFDNCRPGGLYTTTYLEPFNCTLGWQSAGNAEPQRHTASLRLPAGQLPSSGTQTTWNITLPLNAVITKVRAGKPSGGSSSSTNFTYTLTDGTPTTIATAAGNGSTAWSAGFKYESGDLWFNCNTDTKRTLTLTSANITEGSTSSYFLIDYYA